MFQVFEREHAVVGEEKEEAEEAAPHRVRRVRGAAAHDQTHPHLRRRTRELFTHSDSLYLVGTCC